MDARALRFEQGVLAVVLLAGFVFGVEYVLPVVAVLHGLAAALGPLGPLHRLFADLVAPRLDPPGEVEPAAGARVAHLAGLVLASLATAAWAFGLTGVAWLPGLADAGLAAILAATGVNLAARAMERLRRGGS